MSVNKHYIYSMGGGSGGGTMDYSLLENKPKVNNVELTGNKTLDDLGITRIVNTRFVTQDGILIPSIDSMNISSIVMACLNGERIMVGDNTRLHAIEYAEAYSTAYMLGLHVGINEVTYTADYDPIGGVYVLTTSITKPAERVTVISSREEVVDGFTVPVLTTAQVARLYQGLVDGHSCVVSNPDGDVQFKIAMGDGSSGKGSILLQYYWLGMVDYQIAANNTVAITVHKESIPAYEITDVTITDNTIDITIA